MKSPSESPLDVPELFREVLRRCNGRSLAACLRVNKRWRREVEDVLVKERCLCPTLLSRRRNVKECRKELCNFLDNIPCIPAAALIFTNRSKKSYDIKKFMTSLCRKLPSNCQTLVCESLAAVGIKSNGEVDEYSGSGDSVVSILIIPQMPRLLVQTYGIKAGEELKDAIENMKEFDFESPRLIFSMVSIAGWSAEYPFEDFHRRLKDQCSSAAIVGGVSDGSLLCFRGSSLCESDLWAAGLALGGTTLRRAAVVTTGKKLTVRNYFTSVRDQLTLDEVKRTACITCICAGRGSHFHREPNVESGLFQSIFPGAAIAGFFGQGEFGQRGLYQYDSKAVGFVDDEDKTCPGDESSGDEETQYEPHMQFHHTYTSVFGFLTINPEK
eukprot:m.310379 g.310379  ORF g.310379 m.310379 type:complete len:384 (+) comp51292_c0_seq1:430-1581(+)